MRRLGLMLLAAIWLLPSAAFAGGVVVKNIGSATIRCSADGGLDIAVDPGATVILTPTQTGQIIDWLQCGELRASNLNVSAGGPDQYLVFNGEQTSVINVLLYPYQPAVLIGDYQSMVARMIYEYMQEDPSVLLNIVISNNPRFDLYDQANWPKLLGPEGFHAVEADTLQLLQMVKGNYLREVSFDPSEMLDFAVDAVSIEGRTFGIPSTACTNVMFGLDPSLGKVTTGSELISYLSKQSSELKFIGDFSGSTSLSMGYLSAFVDTKGFDEKAMQQFILDPEKYIDPTIVDKMAALFGECKESDGDYPCLDGTFKNVLLAGKAFEKKVAPTIINYTELASCNRVLSDPESEATAIQLLYGDLQIPLVYTDAFLANAAICKNDLACAKRVDKAMKYFTSYKSRSWLTMGLDTPLQKPRYLLLPHKQFWTSDYVAKNKLYNQFKKFVMKGKSSPNYFDRTLRVNASKAICSSLVTKGIKCVFK